MLFRLGEKPKYTGKILAVGINFYAFNPAFDRCGDCDDKPDCGCKN